ncbi:lactonase family protein (plasmid) [Halarchaeum sp. CBA1220]|uniref:lactonase family protein n=1 Tax=Halarchaeum sp. CBA1220 TaxID=1853682 RepID=UPI000F3A9D23|nr:lactonase family protein [Halarchaeum sp. CBA1220]QLC34732.1 lactonase family protein [Halarchaeum sp. CBA1220]
MAEHLAFVCSTDSEDAGVYGVRVETESGDLRRTDALAVARPTYLAAHPDGSTLYAANRDAGGRVAAFDVDHDAGALTRLSDADSGGAGPCYVSVDPAGRFVYAANYDAGTVAMCPLADDGRPGAPTAVVEHEGSGVVDGRQDAPHPHSVVPSPSGAFVYAPDLGTDRVVAYRVDGPNGTLVPVPEADAVLPDGSGPRHLAFAPDGETAYVVNELEATLTALAVDGRGRLSARAHVRTLPAGVDAATTKGADVHVHPSGRWVYASIRGHDVVSVIDARDPDALELLTTVSTDGVKPRDIVLDPTGSLLLAENRDSDTLVAFSVDEESGALERTGTACSIPRPTCAAFVGN